MQDIIYTQDSVAFDCEDCGKPLTIRKPFPESTKSTISCCTSTRYWIRWGEGVLHKDPMLTPTQEFAQKILEFIKKAREESSRQWTAGGSGGAIRQGMDDIEQLCQEEVNKQ